MTGERKISVKETNPLVTVGLPVYNGEKYLAESVSSILSQDVTSLELIISDNGSTDETRSIIRDSVARDSRIRAVYRDDNVGAAWNINHVLDLAHGKYFHWAHHDDLMDPRMLRFCIDALEASRKAVLAYPRTKIIDEHGGFVEEYLNDMHLAQPDAARRLAQYLSNVGLTNAILGVFPTKDIRAVGGLQAYPAGDIVTLARLALRGNFIEVPEMLFSRRIHQKQSWRNFGHYEDLSQWLDPSRNVKIVFTNWRIFGELIRACIMEEMPLDQKLRCLSVVLYRWPRRRWRPLIREVRRIRGKIMRDEVR